MDCIVHSSDCWKMTNVKDAEILPDDVRVAIKSAKPVTRAESRARDVKLKSLHYTPSLRFTDTPGRSVIYTVRRRDRRHRSPSNAAAWPATVPPARRPASNVQTEECRRTGAPRRRLRRRVYIVKFYERNLYDGLLVTTRSRREWPGSTRTMNEATYCTIYNCQVSKWRDSFAEKLR